MFDALQSLEHWVPLPSFFMGRSGVGQDVFPEQWLLVSSFKGPLSSPSGGQLTFAQVLSVPASSQNFLEVVGPAHEGLTQPLTLDPPSHFLHAGFLLWMGKQGLFFHICSDFSGYSFTDVSESSRSDSPR